MRRSCRFARIVALAVLGVLLAVAAAPRAALAQDCGADIKRLSQARESQFTVLNALVKASKGKPLDPGVYCSKGRVFNAAESAMLDYMVKNKDWCSIPDDAISQLQANHAKSQANLSKACSIAAQQRKNQQQQAEGGGLAGPVPQALPSGPL